MLVNELPREIIEEILIRCDPCDVAQVAQTCRVFYSIICCAGDSTLWRELYLAQPLDDPRTAVSHDGYPKARPIDWKMELQRIMRAGTVVTSSNPFDLLRPGELHTVLGTLLDVVCNSAPKRTEESDEVSANLLWVAAMFRRGFLDQIKQADGTILSADERQRIAQLHTYYGITHADARPHSLVQSRAYVYSMCNYCSDTKYGPFTKKGVVNWVHMQALHHVMSMHLISLKEDEDFDFVIFPMSLPYTQTVVSEYLNDDEDWAGLTGSWVVSFCFCDHRDLMAFNEANRKQVDLSLFEDPGFREAFRSLDANLSVVRTEPDPEHPTRPIIHFYGEMQDSSTSTMTGSVKMTADNQIEWQFVSGEVGSTIWSSSGIQVGGLRSSFGVLGSWTTIFHEDDDPIGPFWLCKRSSITPIEI
ncbi:hypothetical protein HYPSUDRAFT_49120 [Hypholoma sublateritium FD-334 SS-4]|uniref:F-box domain-containing protein n=1 Tax=Hypholoma sublateritium (strain FD-334 SS-4) TaxID=945553 RepID=A0A0D2KIL5_HYPSF|nr:hypothetical protein HYPSUDRAFT_49120 [Hypholoma sublateritium FD-334 SS-4]